MARPGTSRFVVPRKRRSPFQRIKGTREVQRLWMTTTCNAWNTPNMGKNTVKPCQLGKPHFLSSTFLSKETAIMSQEGAKTAPNKPPIWSLPKSYLIVECIWSLAVSRLPFLLLMSRVHTRRYPRDGAQCKPPAINPLTNTPSTVMYASTDRLRGAGAF